MYISKKEIGNAGEKIACLYLKQKGYTIIETNFFCRQGEIDIIAKDRNEYVFIEVKTRRNELYGSPCEAVNKKKQKHIYKSTKLYIYIHKLENEIIRFDVIEIYLNKNKCKIKHLKQVDCKE